MATPREVHLVGSVPLSSATEVMRSAATILGPRLRKIPDGETGKRKNWINFQYGVLARHPDFEPTGAAIDPDAVALESDGQGADYAFTPLRLRPGRDGGDLELGELGYAAHALASFAIFRRPSRASCATSSAARASSISATSPPRAAPRRTCSCGSASTAL